MFLHETWIKNKNRIAKIPKRYWIAGAVIFVIIFYMAVFRERTLSYSYAAETCDRQLVVLPELMEVDESAGYSLSTSGGVSIGDYPLWATKICAQAVEAPQPGSAVASLSPFGGSVAKLKYRLEVPDLPQADTSVLNKPIATSRPLNLRLSEPDSTFSYLIKSEDKAAGCTTADTNLECDIPKLKLKQGAEYELSLERQFKGESVNTVADAEVKTLSPLTVKSSSIKDKATIYNKPRAVKISTDKPVEVAEFSLKRLGEEAEDVEVKTQIKDKQVIVGWTEDLPREAEFELQAEAFEADDGSTPLDKYSLRFKTSGGPKVKGVNIGASGVDLNARMVITMDQALKPNQDISKLVRVDGVPAAVFYQDKHIFIQLNNAPKCHDFKISISKDLRSKHDIASNEDWQRSQRTTCHTVTTVGSSHQGRAILAYEFGNGERTVLFVGAIHGNELSTASLMERWIQELEANAKKIPKDKKIVVVPQINPDGVASGSRVNAKNVDLNRNFATSDWEKDITTVSNKPFKGGGGKTAMSEPESKAIAALASRLKPELTLSYHSIGNLLAANQAGNSSALANTYSRLSGYRNTTGQTAQTFKYDITGTWDDYLAEKLGLASILIELGSHSYHQFERNKAAMWAMVKS